MAREQGPKGLKTRGGFLEGEQATSREEDASSTEWHSRRACHPSLISYFEQHQDGRTQSAVAKLRSLWKPRLGGIWGENSGTSRVD